MNYAALFSATLPETALEIAALLVLVVDLGFLRKAAPKCACRRRRFLGIAGCVRRSGQFMQSAWAGFSYGQ